MEAPLPFNESERLDALRRCGLLGTAPEPSFDDLAYLAAQFCGTPMAAVTLLDRDRQWLKARVGVAANETLRSISFCAHTILEPELLIVPDATADERFADNPWVKGEPHIRFYAGAPIFSLDGYAIGSLCVMDQTPRQMEDSQQEALWRLSRLVSAQVAASAPKEKEATGAPSGSREIIAIWESMTDAFVAVDIQWKFVYANSQAAALLRKSREELEDSLLWDIFPDAVGSRFDHECRRSLEQQVKVSFEEFYPPLQAWFEINAYPSPVGLSIYFRDVTRRKKTEQDLEQLRRHHEQILTSIGEGIHGLDAQGRITFANPAATEMLRGESQHLVGRAAHQTMHHSHADGTVYCQEDCPIYATLQDGVTRCVDSEVFWRQDGTCFPVEYTCTPIHDESGRIAGAVVAFRDITRRKQDEEALRLGQERFDILSRATNDAVWDWNLVTNELWWNEGFRTLYGYEWEDIEPGLESWSTRVHPDDLGPVSDSLDNAIAQRQQSWSRDYRFLRADGSYADIFDRGFIIFDARNTPVRMIGSMQDISERKKAEDALQNAKDELEKRVAERTADLEVSNQELTLAKQQAEMANAAKSEFLSRTSHELRTPLNAILGFGQILEMRDLASRDKESVAQILKGGRHLLDLINEILDVAKVEAGRIDLSPESVLLSEAVAESCALVQPLAEQRGVRIHSHESSLSGLRVLADRQRLKQVFINLLSNAIKYNRQGGRVEIAVRPGAPGSVRLEVRDTGSGISPENLSRLFEPFERLDAAHSEIEGSGLGLFLSRRLMDTMGGQLQAESVLGHGSTFAVEMPLAPAQAAAPHPAPSVRQEEREGEASGRHCSVLCIEDNLSNLRLLEVILENRPEITLLAAMQGSVGIDLAQQHRPDLILLDLNLPDIPGKDVLDRLRQGDTAHIPIIIISADATPPQIERLLHAGAAAYLTKPLNVSQFLHTLNDALRISSKSILWMASVLLMALAR
jgi:PAS domain S-box-containing protein